MVELAGMSDRPFRVLFVCLGNICRSPAAHAVFSHEARRRGLSSDIEAESAGTAADHEGDQADSRMILTARRHGVVLDHRARQFRRGDLDYYDLVLVMDHQNERDVLRLARTDAERAKVRLYRSFDPEGGPRDEVPDPWYGGDADFEEVFRMVDRTTGRILDWIPNGRARRR